MNRITKIFSDLSDEELIQAVSEIKEDEVSGIVRSGGMVRKLIIEWNNITGENNTIHMTGVHVGIFREAAFRFLEKSYEKI